jgi:hypothetical protein
MLSPEKWAQRDMTEKTSKIRPDAIGRWVRWDAAEN